MTANPIDPAEWRKRAAAKGLSAKPKPAALPPLTVVVPTATTPSIPTNVPGELTEEQVAMLALFNGEEVEQVEPEVGPKKPTLNDRLLTSPKFAAEVQRQLLQRDAREAVAEIEARRNPAPPFDAGLMRDIEDDTATQWRIEGMLSTGGRLLLIAQRKAGKTTMALNLAYSSIVGTPFLGRFQVAEPITGRVAILNFEVTGGQLKRWASEVGIPEDRLFLVNLRDRRNPLSHPGDRAELITLLRAHDVEFLITDPFGRAFDGESQNDNTAVGKWLAGLDLFASEAGASELALIAHAGWGADGRVRGASALEDWADSIVKLTRDKDDARYLETDGRDMGMAKERLTFDPVTRHLSLSGDVAPSRAQLEQSHFERVGVAALAYLKALRPEGQGVRQIEAGMRAANEEAKRLGAPYVGFRNGEVTKAIAPFREKGWVAVEKVGRTEVHTYVGPEEMSP